MELKAYLESLKNLSKAANSPHEKATRTVQQNFVTRVPQLIMLHLLRPMKTNAHHIAGLKQSWYFSISLAKLSVVWAKRKILCTRISEPITTSSTLGHIVKVIEKPAQCQLLQHLKTWKK